MLSLEIGHWCLTSSDDRRMSTSQREGKCGISEDLRNTCRTTCLAFAVSLAVRSVSELLDGWSPQHFLAETMITMVTDFRSQVVKFIFGGRNSGQNAEQNRDDARFMKAHSECYSEKLRNAGMTGFFSPGPYSPRKNVDISTKAYLLPRSGTTVLHSMIRKANQGRCASRNRREIQNLQWTTILLRTKNL